ncbi:MAG: DUF4254 domain-containing protein [Pirellulales bacterium]|nr:DUF4254 domain-containing protein [Pirellulales bacterium]
MKVEEITALQQQRTAAWHEEQPDILQTGLLGLVEQNHLENFCLWHEEDIARRDDLPAERIRQAKRTIDRHNQRRNDLIESLDRYLIGALHPAEEGCPFNSETPGMMIDRLSILALKEYHMREEAERQDATAKHRTSCDVKLAVIQSQIEDLSTALTELLGEVRAGTRSFRVYFQFKMYNDEQLNPQLRRAA